MKNKYSKVVTHVNQVNWPMPGMRRCVFCKDDINDNECFVIKSINPSDEPINPICITTVYICKHCGLVWGIPSLMEEHDANTINKSQL